MTYACRMRQAVGVRLVVVAAAVAGWLPGGTAGAQTVRGKQDQLPPGAAGYKPVPLNLQKQQLGSAGLPDVGRTRMRAGDYAGALEAFDAALRTLTDPTVFRDRGLCHEQLGHVYPAIDDYRVYLTESPDAPDSDGVAHRLRALEESVAGHAPTASTGDDDTPPGLRASASVRVGTEGASASASTKGPRASDKLEYKEPDYDAIHTPLRKGRGWSLAPAITVHKWMGGSAFKAATESQTWSEAVGLQLRYAVGGGGAVVAELGFEHFNATSVDTVQVSGLTSLVGYEFQIALDPEYDDQVIIMPALGYEHLSVSYADASLGTQSIGGFVPRLRGGWRHMLQAATAIDVSLDVGGGSFFPYDKFPHDSSQTVSGLVALNVSVAWGL
jgi:hypothetical protein